MIVAGPRCGAIKQIDTTSVTVGNEKISRVVKLAPGGKVMIGEKEGKLADLKVGDRATVTLTSDESAAVLYHGRRQEADRRQAQARQGRGRVISASVEC